MNDLRDPELLALFTAATDDIPGEAFVARLGDAIEKERGRTRLRNVALAFLFVAVEWLLGSPLSEGVGSFATVLQANLVPVANPWVDLVFSPINSVAGLVGLSLLGLHIVYRKVFA